MKYYDDKKIISFIEINNITLGTKLSDIVQILKKASH